jgi:hypothetical protein
MSEVPMGGFGAPAPELPESGDAPARDPRLLIGGGIGLAVVALGGAYLLLGGGGGGSADASAPPVVRHQASTTPSATVIPVGTATTPVKVFKGDVGRDPFQALVTPTTPAPVKTQPASPTATTLPATTTSPGAVVAPPTLPVTTVPVTPLTPAPTTSATAKVMIVLKAIAYPNGATEPYVDVTYSGHAYVMKTGDTADGSLKVLAIAPDDGTATFTLGDQTFDLHIGQSYVD